MMGAVVFYGGCCGVLWWVLWCSMVGAVVFYDGCCGVLWWVLWCFVGLNGLVFINYSF